MNCKNGTEAGMQLTASEKEDLVERVTDLAIRDILQQEDRIQILRICREACDRRIAEIEERTRPTGREQ